MNISTDQLTEALNIVKEASHSLSLLLGEDVEIVIIKPSLPELTPEEQKQFQVRRQMFLNDIIDKVCEQYGITVANLRSDSRFHPMPDARKMIAMLIKQHAIGVSDTEIGKLIGRERSTAIVSAQAGKDLLMVDKDFRYHHAQVLKKLTKTITKNDQTEINA